METHVIDFAPLINDYLLPLLGAALTAVVSWGISKIAKFFNVKIDDTQRAFVMALVDRGIAVGQQKIAAVAADKARLETQSLIAAEAVNYVVARAPDALKHFKLTPTDVKQIIDAKLSEGLVVEAKAAITPPAQ